MSYRTNPDRILENIDRSRARADEGLISYARQASGRELDTEIPPSGATVTERARRIFGIVERAYVQTAQSDDLRRLAARFQAIGDISHRHAKGDVTVAVHYVDAPRDDDVGMAPFEITPEHLDEAKKVTKNSRPDVNALKVLRERLRDGVAAAYKRIEPRIREGLRERGDMGHVAVQVTVDLRPAE
jgi:hypothetical protein